MVAIKCLCNFNLQTIIFIPRSNRVEYNLDHFHCSKRKMWLQFWLHLAIYDTTNTTIMKPQTHH
jgi:hypothetical protein